MSVTVTLHIFSGIPDPTWELTSTQVEELSDRLARVSQTTLQKPAGIVGGLGYRGMSIQAVRERRLSSQTYIYRGVIDLERFDLNLSYGGADLEEWLLSTSAGLLDGEVVDEALRGIRGGEDEEHALAEKVLVVPPYNPGKWNNDPGIQARNNCYNYANDKITNSFAQPGRGSGNSFARLDCPSVGTAAQHDGQRSVPSAAETPAQGHFIALVVWPGKDYHWYRLDDNAQWSHKPGRTQARNTDNSGRAIRDPQACDRGPYASWCGYFHCVPANTRIA